MEKETKNCQSCKTEFTIGHDDFLFYKKMNVPVPNECPSCRRMRRLAFGNYTTLFQRPNNAPTGGMLISCYPKEAPFPVFDFDYYWGNEHHPEDYFVEYVPGESFFSQFEKLHKIAPRPVLQRDPANIGSDYSNYGINLKNCFYSFGGINAENADYCLWPLYTKDTQDSTIILACDRIYEGIFPERSYNSSFIYFSKDVLNSKYMYDCRSCSDCIGCVNLRHKRFHVFNENVGEEKYKKIAATLETGGFIEHQKTADKFWRLVRSSPIRGERNENTEVSSGVYLVHDKNVQESIWVLNSKDCKWVDFVENLRDSSDVTISYDAELMYNTALSGTQSWNNICTLNCRNTGDTEYSVYLDNCLYCFGCIGLKNKKFCIFNKQYEEAEYYRIVAEIKENMRKEGTYGEFFPYSLSPFPYNATLAQVIFPKNEEEIKAIGSYYSEPVSNVKEGSQVFETKNLPDSILDITKDIIQYPILDEISGRPFRVRDADLQFYQHQKVPLPHEHPNERMKKRFEIVNRFIIEDCSCKKCGVSFRGALSSDTYITYCDSCYAAEIN